MRLSNRNLIRVTPASTIILGMTVTLCLSARATTASGGPSIVEFDFADDGSRFVFDETPVAHEDGLPAYGCEVVAQGYLYPAGTLTCEDGECNGVNADGSPEFPDQVIGTWTCYGTHIGDGAHTVTGPWVATTQVFDFGDAPGEVSIVTSGIELADLTPGRPVAPTMARWTGTFVRRGEQTQVFMGFNESFDATRLVTSNPI